ncbi:hypothetical protein EV702DRAFT_1202554 [Suillus placidus]|uniref:Uncharacterized protein n=1 Tax=Suillus placidus TaxID=48579 RepID=A0A9P6ZKF3_9AGAM|nr:hypothetical protein EV702DRAFT_1202554 [Suillus placidus]
MSIQWQSETALTDALVNYLTSHPSDCRILFYPEGKKKVADADDNPTGKDKGAIYGAIAQLTFANHIKYGAAYRQNQKKCCNSVSNQISGLRTKYKKHKGRFTATGAGVVLLDGQSAQNLLELVPAEFPWFSDLDSIWHNNPSMVAKTYPSQPGVDHAGALYSLVQPHGRAGPSMHFGATAAPAPSILAAQSSHAYPPPNTYPPPSTYPPLTSFVNEPLNANIPKRLPPLTSSVNELLNTNVPQRLPPLTSSVNKLLNVNVPQRLPRMPDLSPNAYPPPNAYPAPNKYPPPNAFPSPNTSTPPCPPLHLPGLYTSPDVDVNIRNNFGAADDNDNLYSEGVGPFSAPLRNALEHLDGKKHQLPTSPSPPPNVPSPFKVPSNHGGECKPSSEMSRSMSTPMSTTRNTTPSSDYCMSPTPQTSLLNSAGGSKKKKAKSDVVQEVVHIRDEIESMHSDVMSRNDNKHQCFLAKLDAKSEHNRDSKKYEGLCGAREHEASQATISHQCLQQQQDAEIRLRKTDIRVHQAHSLVLNKEAKTLWLKIQFHQMMQGNKTLASDGAT